MKNNYIKQKERLIINIFLVFLLFILNKLIFNNFLPTLDNKSLWFLCSLLNIILANQLVNPYFTKPVDSISYSVAAFVTVIMIRPEESWSTISHLLFMTILIYAGIIIAISIVCIFLKDSMNAKGREISDQLRIILNTLGSATVIFSLIILFSLVTFHVKSPREILWISIAYILFIIQKPVTNLYALLLKIFNYNALSKQIIDSGEIVAYQEPNIILVKQDTEREIPYMTSILIKDQYSMPQLGFTLDFVGKADGVLLRTFIFEKTQNKAIVKDAKYLNYNSVWFVNEEYFKKNDVDVNNDKIIGLVTTESTIEIMNFEIIVNEDVSVGSLVSTKIHDREIIYQVINGFTKEEIVQRKNTYGYIKVLTRKIGEWNIEKKRFSPSQWLPMINSPIYKCIQEKTEVIDPKAIGHFLESNYTVHIDDINSLVTHNTAILGILGIGKSMLSIEIIERIINSGVKVICLDLTNQYNTELSDFIDKDYEDNCIENIQTAGKKDREKWEENPEEGGSLNHFSNAISNDINDLIENDKNRNLKVYNPSQLFATKQRNEPKQFKIDGNWIRSAQLYTMTSVEITQIITETLLDIVSDKMTDKARVCIVFEEAHSLIPEWNSVVTDSDKNATSGTARAILQGRKYGLGCILITQRTANVTKTILNQCNSIFAMRTFDDTGKNFLSNYIGEDYTNVLSSIPERHAVYFGKSSSCENPVLLRLNDREDFIEHYRSQHPVAPPVQEVSQAKEDDSAEDFEDDMPF